MNTVTTPTTAPLKMPLALTAKSGMSTHSPFTTKRKIRHSTQQVTVPSAQPMGMAVLHQFSASSCTKWMMSRLQTDAATITPAANPVSARWMWSPSDCLRKNTLAAPSEVPRNGIRIP